MLTPPVVAEIEYRLRIGQNINKISADLTVPVPAIQQVRDRMVASAAPRDHRLDSLLDAGDSSHRAATQRLAARTRVMVDQLRVQVAADKKERDLLEKVENLSASLASARAELKQVRR